MDLVIYLFIFVVAIAATLSAITVWARRRTWIKAVALGLAALLMVSFHAGALELLGKPKPVTMEWARGQVEEATVLGSKLVEGEAIYLWLQLEEGGEPMSYILPWDMAAAKQLKQAGEDAEARGTAVQMRQPFEPDETTSEPLFYPQPQPRLPPKYGANG